MKPKNLFYKTSVILLAMVLLFSASGCGLSATVKNVYAEGGDAPAVVWFAPSTQKIRPDMEAEVYEDIRTDVLEFSGGRFEYESAQIIMSAKRDIGEYELSVSDLTLVEDSSVIYKAENIEVYNQSYITVTSVKESSPLSTPGLYPDALIPFAAAAKYGENSVGEGKNQGVWVTFYIPEAQTAGTYSGTFTLSMDGYSETIPVRLHVWDFDFAQNYTAKSCFLINWTSMSYAELDSSQDMYDAYAEALLDYRLNPGLLMNDFVAANAEDRQYYTEKAFDFAHDPRCTTVFMPFVIDNGRGNTYLVVDEMKEWIRSFVEISLDSYGTEKQLNLIEKTMLYFTFVDEPTMLPGLTDRANIAQETWATLRGEVQAEYEAQLEKDKDSLTPEEYAFRAEVIAAIGEIKNVLTGPHDSRLKGIEVYCPLVDDYDSEQNRESYAQDEERWWYTAVGPKYPYPTYHIDDTNLLSARLLSWMQADYDVVGNLYWATNLYNDYINEEFLENPYEYAMRFSSGGGANGDGFLFYPGKKYGVNGPIGSVRLHAIRDGMEEYEILRGIERVYEEINASLSINGAGVSVDFEKIYAKMSENLYSGTAVYTTQAYFDEARTLMGNLAELATIGGAVASINIAENAEIQVIVPTNCTVEYDEQDGTVSQSSPADGYTMYTFTQALGEESNVFSCKVKYGNKTIDLNIYLGGTIRSFAADDLTAGITYGVEDQIAVSEKDYVLANTVDTSLPDSNNTEWLRLSLPEATARLRQSLIVGNETLLAEIGKNTQKFVIKIYNDRDISGADGGDYTYRLQFKYGNSDYYTEIRQGSLKPGYNEITVGNVFGYDWDSTGPLSSIRLYFGETGSAATSDLYVIGVDVYYV